MGRWAINITRKLFGVYICMQHKASPRTQCPEEPVFFSYQLRMFVDLFCVFVSANLGTKMAKLACLFFKLTKVDTLLSFWDGILRYIQPY